MKSKKLKIGADAWLYGPSGYRKGTKPDRQIRKRRPGEIKKHKRQRVAQGYSWFDWINFDTFIAGVVATAALRFAEESHGYFAIGGEGLDPKYSWPEGTAENYTATCGAIYFALSEWLNHDDSDWDAQQVRWAEAREAMILFSEHLSSWWD